MAKKPRARAERRMQERVARKLVHDKQRLAALVEGGGPGRPFEVASASVIPVRAQATPCPLCGDRLVLDEETAEKIDGESLRAAHVRCYRCGVRRTLWFRIAPVLPS